MKKLRLILCTASIAIILVVLTACGRNDDRHLENDNRVAPWPYEVTQAQRDYFAHLTREDFIYDLDYLMAVLEENFEMHLGIIQRRIGVDLRANANSLRQVLADEELELDPWVFASLLQAYICTPAHLVGHLRLFPPVTYHRRLHISRWEVPGILHPNLMALNSPASVMFYGEPQSADADDTLPANISWEIIEDGRIAYMNIRSMRFDTNWVDEFTEAYRFYGKIADFEHLIIDIRGNRGGHGHYFTRLVLDVFAEAPMYIPQFALHTTRGEYNRRFLEFYLQASETAETWAGGTWHGPELMDDMVYLPEQYRQMFDITRNTSWRIGEFGDSDIDNWLRWHLPARIFDGKIWLLIDGETYSAADVAARQAKYAGIATLVGEPAQGGHGGGNMIYVSLPNTGVVFMYDWGVGVDQYGRHGDSVAAYSRWRILKKHPLI